MDGRQPPCATSRALPPQHRETDDAHGTEFRGQCNARPSSSTQSTDQDCSRHLHAPNSHPPETDPLQHPIGGSKWTHHPLSPLDSLGFSVCPESVRGVCVPTAKAGNPGTRGFSKGAIPQAHARMARNLGNRAVCRRLQAAWGRLLSHRFAGCRAGRSSSRAPTGPFPRGAKNSGPISKRA